MEIGSSKEGCFKSDQGHARSGYEGRKKNEGSVFLPDAINIESILLLHNMARMDID